MYTDPIYRMLQETTINHHKRIGLENHAWILMFRIMFGYIRPEL